VARNVLSVNSDTFTIAAVVLDGLSKWGLTDLNNVERATKPKVMQATLNPPVLPLAWARILRRR
jgi:hypothetical protein